MAVALQPLLGNWATVLIGIGLLAAGFSSAITAPLSAAYAVNGVLGWGKTLKDLKFKAVWIIVLVAGCLMAVLLGKSPTELILVAQAANAILLPIMAFFQHLRRHLHLHHAVHVLAQYVQLPDHAANAYRRIAASVTESVCKGLSDESPAGPFWL